MERDIALALVSSVSVVAGLFVALLLSRLEGWSADARSAVAQLRGVQKAAFADRDEGLHAELHCWEVRDDLPLGSSILIDLIVAGSAVATYVIAQGSPLASSALALTLPAVVLLLLVLLAEALFLGSGLRALGNAPYKTFVTRP